MSQGIDDHSVDNQSVAVQRRLFFGLGWKELWVDRKFTTLFVFNLTIGMLGFLILFSFKQAIEGHLGSRTRAILSADLELSATRPLTEEEITSATQVLPPGSISHRMQSMMSMVAYGKKSRLLQLKPLKRASLFTETGNFKK